MLSQSLGLPQTQLSLLQVCTLTLLVHSSPAAGVFRRGCYYMKLIEGNKFHFQRVILQQYSSFIQLFSSKPTGVLCLIQLFKQNL